MKLTQDLKVEDKTYKKGTPCPESEIPRLLRHNREYLDLEYKEGYPVLTKEQEKKYGVIFPPQSIKKVMKIEKRNYNQEKLTIKLNELGAKEFKIWAEKQFGEDLDRRKTAKAMIVEILRRQEAERR